jgi:hypothetical protein
MDHEKKCDFENLSRKKYSFMSNKGQLLFGYMYQASDSAKAIIVFAHGLGGGGHNSYMSCIFHGAYYDSPKQ